MSDLDALIKLGEVFNTELALTKDVTGLYLVWIRRVSSKESRSSAIISSVCGRGESVELACGDYLRRARGTILIGDDPEFYGKDRPEFICV